MKRLYSDYVETPIGTVVIVVDGDQMCALDFKETEQRMMKLLERRYGEFHLVEKPDVCGFSELVRRYFQGDYQALDSIPVNTGGTAFQREVWSALRSIPPGTTMSYGRLAAQLGKPFASRAVGSANSLNPVAIVLPCHRVIGADASLTGYAGGLENKRWLLQHEGYMAK